MLKSFYTQFDASYKFSIITSFFDKEEQTKIFFSTKNFFRKDIKIKSYFLKILPSNKVNVEKNENFIEIEGLKYFGVIFLTFLEYNKIEN